MIHVQTPRNEVIKQLNVGNVRPTDQEEVHNCNFVCVCFSLLSEE